MTYFTTVLNIAITKIPSPCYQLIYEMGPNPDTVFCLEYSTADTQQLENYRTFWRTMVGYVHYIYYKMYILPTLKSNYR